MPHMGVIVAVVLLWVMGAVPASAGTRSPTPVELVRVPNGGIQPDVVADAAGVVHMIYLSGDPAASDVFYVRSTDGGRTFSPALRVNSLPGSAIATGTIRGAQVALGRDGLVHVAWNGSATALPAAPVNPRTGRPGMPMLYSRSDGARGFEPQRNLITRTTNLDGGGSIAADAGGGVYVAWHASPASGDGGEDARRVWMSHSIDDGATFAQERPISDPSTGVCACCALRLAVTSAGELQVLYRSARDLVHRDVYALVSRDRGRAFASTRLHAWEIGACPMSSMSIVSGQRLLRAWETDGQVYMAADADAVIAPRIAARDGTPPRRKHPRVAVDDAGRTLLVWTEGTGWNRGGSVAWQAFDGDGRPTDESVMRPEVPVWSFAAVVARRGGGFLIYH